MALNDYPKLRKSGNLVVMFDESHKGTVTVGSGKYKVGYYSSCWASCEFTDIKK